MVIAIFAIVNAVFALAQKSTLTHISRAFQASSPKTSRARSATTGPFFALNPRPKLQGPNRYGLRSRVAWPASGSRSNAQAVQKIIFLHGDGLPRSADSV